MDEYREYRYAPNLEQVMAKLHLPPLPTAVDVDTPDARQLVLFFFRGDHVVLAPAVSLEDAREYCSRDDTYGDSWFVGSGEVGDY